MVNLEWGKMALERFLLQKQTTLSDDDVAELGYFDLGFSLKALDVYCKNLVPTSPSIVKFAHAKKELAKRAFDVLLKKPQVGVVCVCVRERERESVCVCV
jgi:hypothetical protein